MVQEPSRDPGRETVQGTWEGESVEYFANRVIVKFKAGREDASGISSIAADLVAEVDETAAIVRPPGATRRALVAVTAEADVAEVAAKLSARPDVAVRRAGHRRPRRAHAERHAAAPSSGRSRWSTRSTRGTSRPATRPC